MIMMQAKHFIFVAESTGEIVRVTHLRGAAQEPPQAPAGSYALEFEYGGSLPAYWTGGAAIPVPESPGPGHRWEWAPRFAWVYDEVLGESALSDLRNARLAEVDSAAGSARLRYITSVPGQAETYTRKEQQARNWAGEGFAGAPPSFIAAEADALGRPPQSVAEEVISLADQWSNVIGPAIEAARRKWKVAIEGATTVEAIEAARASAIAELAGL